MRVPSSAGVASHAVTEQQRYEAIGRFEGFQLRRCSRYSETEVTVRAGFEEACDRAFGALFGYTNGDKRAPVSVAMTAPVVQSAPRAQKVAMTAPEVQQPHEDARQRRRARSSRRNVRRDGFLADTP